ncbi:MAG TPA: type II toxin-antitoxin system RelE/ParE family toxin [Actinocatenispora sp.]
MIQSFADRRTEHAWGRLHTNLPQDIQRRAWAKLLMLNNAGRLSDLQVPPGNRLEPLQGDRKGQHSIRINDQWRIYFHWTDAGPAEVEIVDYH